MTEHTHTHTHTCNEYDVLMSQHLHFPFCYLFSICLLFVNFYFSFPLSPSFVMNRYFLVCNFNFLLQVYTFFAFLLSGFSRNYNQHVNNTNLGQINTNLISIVQKNFTSILCMVIVIQIISLCIVNPLTQIYNCFFTQLYVKLEEKARSKKNPSYYHLYLPFLLVFMQI